MSYKLPKVPSLHDVSLESISIDQFSYGDDSVAHPTDYLIKLNYLVNGWEKQSYCLKFRIETVPGLLANDIDLVALGGCPYTLTKMDFRKIRKIINNHINSYYS